LWLSSQLRIRREKSKDEGKKEGRPEGGRKSKEGAKEKIKIPGLYLSTTE
jgi:hypothetical protein